MDNNNNDDDENSGGASEPVPSVPNATESFNDSYVSPATIETEVAENVYDSLDVLGGLSEQASQNLTETTVSLDNETSATGDLLF